MIHELLVAANAVNIVILSLLIYVYWGNYRRIRSRFNLGLLIFSCLFFIENALILHLGLFQWPVLLSEIVGLHLIIIDFIETLGLLTLLFITWK